MPGRIPFRHRSIGHGTIGHALLDTARLDTQAARLETNIARLDTARFDTHSLVHNWKRTLHDWTPHDCTLTVLYWTTHVARLDTRSARLETHVAQLDTVRFDTHYMIGNELCTIGHPYNYRQTLLHDWTHDVHDWTPYIRNKDNC